MTMEEWRQIPSFPIYEASSLGRVRSAYRVLKPWLNDDGYWQVTVYFGGSRFTRPVHVLVCEAFHGPKPMWAQHAAHNNGVKTLNRPGNVRWSTALDNSADAKRHGTIRRGSEHPKALFTESQVGMIRAQYRIAPQAATIKRLADAYIVTPQTIRNIVKNRSWRAS